MRPPESLIGAGPSQGLHAAAIILEFFPLLNATYKSCTFLCLKTPGCFEYGTGLPRECAGGGESSDRRWKTCTESLIRLWPVSSLAADGSLLCCEPCKAKHLLCQTCRKCFKCLLQRVGGEWIAPFF